MLTSINYGRYIGYDKATKRHSYQYEIEDDFISTVCVKLVVAEAGVDAWMAVSEAASEVVIDMYASRGLPIVPELVRTFIIMSERYLIPISRIIQHNRQQNSTYLPFADAVDAHLLLL